MCTGSHETCEGTEQTCPLKMDEVTLLAYAQLVLDKKAEPTLCLLEMMGVAQAMLDQDRVRRLLSLPGN